MDKLDHMLGFVFQNEEEFNLLDDNFNGKQINNKVVNDENSFFSSKATPLTTFRSNDKVKPRGLRINDSDRNINSNSPIPGLNRTKSNDFKIKSDNILFSKNGGVRFNENIKIDTITGTNKVNVGIFSPEGDFSDQLTRLAGHTPFVDSNNHSAEDEGRKYVDMHNFKYDTKWSPLDGQSPMNSNSSIKPNFKPSVCEDIINQLATTNVSPSFLITNNNGYNFNDSIDVNPCNNIDHITKCSPNLLSNGCPSNNQNFKSISADALTSFSSPNPNVNPNASFNPDTNMNLTARITPNTSPTIIHYLEQDEIKKQEDNPQISQRISFRKDSPVVIQHLINQIPTPRSITRSSSAPPTRIITNFDSNNIKSPMNASNISPSYETYQTNTRRVYDDSACSPYGTVFLFHNRTPNTNHTFKQVTNTTYLSTNSNNKYTCGLNINDIDYISADNENTGVSRIRPGLGLRKNNAFKHELPSMKNSPKPVSNPNPPSAIKVVNPIVSVPDKKPNPFASNSNKNGICAATNTNDEHTVESIIKDENNVNSNNNFNSELNSNDVSIQCPSVRNYDVSINNDSVNFDDNSSYGDNDKVDLETLISPNSNPIKSLLSKISNSNTNLGTASRILKNGYSNSENLKPSLKQDFDVRAVDLNVTFSENNLSNNESVFEPVFTTINYNTKVAECDEIDNSMAMTCVTTLTLDSFDVTEANSFDRPTCKANVEGKSGPRLNLASKKVRKDDFDDMKEVTMFTVPGEFTTIMLEFGNKKKTRQTIFSKATCMRFDPRANSDTVDDNINDVFQVSPHTLEIPFNSQKALYLTFAPNSQKEGIYTGVLKIKNCKKSFVLLLRGEARYPPENKYSEPAAKIDSNIQDYDFEISDDENENKQSDDDEPLLGLDLDVGLARPPDYKKFSDLLAQNDTNKRGGCITSNVSKNRNSDSNFDWSDTLSRCGILESDCLRKHTSNYSNTNTHASSLGDMKTVTYNDNIAEKVASDLLKVRQKVIKDWLGKENNKRKENHLTTSPSVSSSYSNIFSVLSKNSSTYQPTPNNVNTDSRVIGTKYDFSVNSKANTTASSKQTLYSSQGLKSNDLVKTIANDSITSPSIGLFFRRQSISFGPVAVGTLARLKVELCNGSDHDISVLIGDPSLPFVLLHNEVHIKARSYVRIPIRFVPVFHSPNGYTAELIAQSTDGQQISKVNLAGNTFY